MTVAGRVLMRQRLLWIPALMVGLVALGVADVARAEMKIAILRVKGMVCPS